MRIAALIFGLLAGLCGLAVAVMGNIQPDLAANSLLGANGEIIARTALLGLPALCFFAAGLVLGAPRFASVLLLLGAIGWAAIAWVAGHGAIFLAALPFTFAAAAGLVAAFGRRGSGEIAAPVATAEAASAPPLRTGRVTLRSEPEFERPPVARQPSAPATEPAVNDVVAEALAAAAAPVIAPAAVPVEPVELPAAPAPASAALAATTPVIAEPAPPPPQLPPLEPRLPPIPARPEPMAEAVSPPPAVAAQESPPASPAEPPRQPEPLPVPPPPAEPPPAPAAEEPAPAAIHPRYEELPVDDGPRRGDGLRRALRFLIALLFLLVVAAIVVAVVMDYRRGAQSALFGDRHAAAAPAESPSAPAPAPAAPTSTPAPTAEPAPTPAVVPNETKSVLPPAANPLPTPQALATPVESKPVQVAEAAPVTPPPASDAAPDNVAAAAPAAADTPASPVAPPAPDATSGFSDPLAYCKAVGTIDEPDGRFVGPAVPPLIGRALLQVNGNVQGPIHWRCESGDVRACDSRGQVVCELTPTADEMIAYCAKHPGTKNLPAPNGSWSCKGKKPVIPPDQKWPVDARGYFPDAWITIKISTN